MSKPFVKIITYIIHYMPFFFKHKYQKPLIYFNIQKKKGQIIMAENYTEYRRERRRTSAPPRHTSPYSARFMRQAAISLLLFGMVYALNISNGTAAKKSVGYIKSVLEYKVDTAKLSSLIGTLASDVKSNIKITDRAGGKTNREVEDAKNNGTSETNGGFDTGI